MRVNIQVFAPGEHIWHAPPGIGWVLVVARGGDGGSSTGAGGRIQPGEPGELSVAEFTAGQIPARMEVSPGPGGPGGRDGYVAVLCSDTVP